MADLTKQQPKHNAYTGGRANLLIISWHPGLEHFGEVRRVLALPTKIRIDLLLRLGCIRRDDCVSVASRVVDRWSSLCFPFITCYIFNYQLVSIFISLLFHRIPARLAGVAEKPTDSSYRAKGQADGPIHCQLRGILVASTLLVGIVSAQNSTLLPDCTDNCVSSLIPAGCNLDIKCICTDTDFLDTIACCVFNACDTADQQAALTYAHVICDPVGASSFLPASAGCATDSASASTPISSLPTGVSSSASNSLSSSSPISASNSLSASSPVSASTFDITIGTLGPTSATAPTISASGSPTSSSSLTSGAKIGIGVTVPVGVIIIAAILACFLARRRRTRREKQQNETGRPDRGHAEETQDNPEDFKAFYMKPELEAEPVIDPTIRGPVKSKFELRSQGTTRAKANGDSGAVDAAEGLNVIRLWSHESGEYTMPSELQCNPMSEAGTSTSTEQQTRQPKQQTEGSKMSTSTSSAAQPSSDLSPLQPPQILSTEVSELAEEADVLVQELGLISRRKKALTTQALAVGKEPEQVEGRKGEEFRELLVRESRLKRRLDAIDPERQGQGVT